MAIRHHVELWKGKILLNRSGGLSYVTKPNFIEIGPSLVEILRFFDLSKRPPLPSWFFEFVNFYWLKGSRGTRRTIVLNFVKISQSVAKILLFFDFSRWRPSAILALFWAHLDHPLRVLSGLYRCAKFGYGRWRSFDNMNVSIGPILCIWLEKNLVILPK